MNDTLFSVFWISDNTELEKNEYINCLLVHIIDVLKNTEHEKTKLGLLELFKNISLLSYYDASLNQVHVVL